MGQVVVIAEGMIYDGVLSMVELEKMLECSGSFVRVGFYLVRGDWWDGEGAGGRGGAEEAGDDKGVWYGGERREHCAIPLQFHRGLLRSR